MGDSSGGGFQGRVPDDDLLRELLELVGAKPGAPPSLEQLKKEARAYGMRRADRIGGRDNLIYRMGYALDAIGGLGINPNQLAGVLTSADLMREIVNSYGEEELEVSLIMLISIALARPAIAEWAEAEGRRYQWERLHELNALETAAFKASPAFQAEDASWRKKKPTKAQLYLIGEIVRLSDIEDPGCTTRGEAFEFIDSAGGNPRFGNAPAPLERPRYS